MADLMKYGKVRRPWLGVVGKNILSQDEYDLDRNGVYGVIVTNLIVDGPAYKSGLQIGDLLMSLGSQKIDDIHQLHQLLSKKSIMESVRLKYYRRGKGFRHTNIALQEMPPSEDLPQKSDLL